MISNIYDMAGNFINEGADFLESPFDTASINDYIKTESLPKMGKPMGFENFFKELNPEVKEEQLEDIINEITYQPEATFVADDESEEMLTA